MESLEEQLNSSFLLLYRSCNECSANYRSTDFTYYYNRSQLLTEPPSKEIQAKVDMYHSHLDVKKS